MATKVERHLLTIHADRSISVETDIPIVAGSIGVDEVLISFEEPEDWADMSLTVTMVSSVVETPYTVLWDGESAFNVPWELTQEIGVIGFSVLGISSSTQSYQRGLTQSSVGLLTVVTPGINVGDPPVEPTPSAYERVLAMIQSLPEVESRAEAVINDLDNAFRGVAQYLPVGMGNVVTAELDGTDSELVSVADAFKNGKLLGAKVYGKSTQESTTGANLWEFGDLAGEYGSGNLFFNNPLQPGTYTITYDLTSSDTDANQCLFRFFNGTAQSYEVAFYKNIDRGTAQSFTINLTKQADFFYFLASTSAAYSSGGDTFSLSNVMLNAGSTALPWEPYTGGIASPNPDYPQEIKSVAEGDVWLTGNNSFFNYLQDYNVDYFDLNNGVLSNKVTDTRDYICLQLQFYNNQSTFIGYINLRNITATGHYDDVIHLPDYDFDTTRLVHNGIAHNIILYMNLKVFQSNIKDYVISYDVISYDPKTTGGFKIKNLMATPGTTPATYEPYTSPDTLHFLPDDIEPLRSLPDGTRDILTIDANGNGIIERNVGVFDLSNQNRWSKSSYGNFDRFSSYSVIGNAIKTTARYANVLSDKFMHSSDPIANPNTPNTIALYNQVVYILVDKDIYNTDTFKTYIGSIKPTLFYQLATPITEIIPASRMPKVPSQYLHAWLEAKDQNGEEIVTNYSIYYEKSIGALLSQIEQALDAAGYPITDYEPEDAMSVAPELSNDANPVTDAQMAAAVTYGFTLN